MSGFLSFSPGQTRTRVPRVQTLGPETLMHSLPFSSALIKFEPAQISLESLRRVVRLACVAVVSFPNTSAHTGGLVPETSPWDLLQGLVPGTRSLVCNDLTAEEQKKMERGRFLTSRALGKEASLFHFFFMFRGPLLICLLLNLITLIV